MHALAEARAVGSRGNACGSYLQYSTLLMMTSESKALLQPHFAMFHGLHACTCSKRVSGGCEHGWAWAGQQWLHAAKQHVVSRLHVTKPAPTRTSSSPCCRTSVAAARLQNNRLTSGFQPLKADMEPVPLAASARRAPRHGCLKASLLHLDGSDGKRKK